jgi:hypothetical protein
LLKDVRLESIVEERKDLEQSATKSPELKGKLSKRLAVNVQWMLKQEAEVDTEETGKSTR